MIINIYVCIGLFFLFSIVLPTIFVFSLKNKEKTLKILTIISFVAYLLVLFIATTFELGFNYPNISLTPNFNEEWFSMNFIAFGFGKLNILLNLIMFLPLGFVIFVFCKKHKLLKTILFSLFLSIFIELIQFILPITRNTEILDILLNTLSGTISALFCMILQKFGAFEQTKKES